MVKVTATLELAEDVVTAAEVGEQRRLGEMVERTQRHNPFKDMRDPVEGCGQVGRFRKDSR